MIRGITSNVRNLKYCEAKCLLTAHCSEVEGTIQVLQAIFVTSHFKAEIQRDFPKLRGVEAAVYKAWALGTPPNIYCKP